MTHAMFRVRCAAVARFRPVRHASARRQRLSRARPSAAPPSTAVLSRILPSLLTAVKAVCSFFRVDGLVVRRVQHLEDELQVLRKQLSHLETQTNAPAPVEPLLPNDINPGTGAPPEPPLAPPAPPLAPPAPPTVPLSPLLEAPETSSRIVSDLPTTTKTVQTVKQQRPAVKATSQVSGASFKTGHGQPQGRLHMISAEQLTSVKLKSICTDAEVSVVEGEHCTRAQNSDLQVVSVEDLRSVRLRKPSERPKQLKKFKGRRTRSETKIQSIRSNDTAGADSDCNDIQTDFSLLRAELAKRFKSLCSPAPQRSSNPSSDTEWTSPATVSNL